MAVVLHQEVKMGTSGCTTLTQNTLGLVSFDIFCRSIAATFAVWNVHGATINVLKILEYSKCSSIALLAGGMISG